MNFFFHQIVLFKILKKGIANFVPPNANLENIYIKKYFIDWESPSQGRGRGSLRESISSQLSTEHLAVSTDAGLYLKTLVMTWAESRVWHITEWDTQASRYFTFYMKIMMLQDFFNLHIHSFSLDILAAPAYQWHIPDYFSLLQLKRVFFFLKPLQHLISYYIY